MHAVGWFMNLNKPMQRLVNPNNSILCVANCLSMERDCVLMNKLYTVYMCIVILQSQQLHNKPQTQKWKHLPKHIKSFYSHGDTSWTAKTVKQSTLDTTQFSSTHTGGGKQFIALHLYCLQVSPCRVCLPANNRNKVAVWWAEPTAG